MNKNNEAIKVPNQYANYISETGYKKATGMPIMRSGGRAPLEISDPKEFKLRQQAYRDSSDLFNSTGNTGLTFIDMMWTGGWSIMKQTAALPGKVLKLFTF
jgi:hypothetical protein